MKIVVEHVPVQGKEVSFSFGDSWVQQACVDSKTGQFIDCQGTMKLLRSQQQVVVHVQGGFHTECNCDRCGDLVAYKDTLATELVYVPESVADARQPDLMDVLPSSARDLDKIDQQIALENDELDLGWYADGQLDLSLVLTEAISLQAPMLITCNLPCVTRIDSGTCRNVPMDTDDDNDKNMYKPFAGLHFP